MSKPRPKASYEMTQELLRSILFYEPTTGEFTWLQDVSWRMLKGMKAGTLDKGNGYMNVAYQYRSYKLHRLAWFYVHNEWPAFDIDHINGNRADNRISNLRSVTRAVNLQNQRLPKTNNKSGFLGVYWNKWHKKWATDIAVNGKKQHIGYFDKPEDAHEAHLQRKRAIHEGCTI